MMEIFLLRCCGFNNFRSVTARRTLKHTQEKKEETTNTDLHCMKYKRCKQEYWIAFD